MSPDGQTRTGKPVASNNLYTIILALAFCIVLATAALVAYKCYFQYGTIFRGPKRPLSRLGAPKYRSKLTIDGSALYL